MDINWISVSNHISITNKSGELPHRVRDFKWYCILSHSIGQLTRNISNDLLCANLFLFVHECNVSLVLIPSWCWAFEWKLWKQSKLKAQRAALFSSKTIILLAFNEISHRFPPLFCFLFWHIAYKMDNMIACLIAIISNSIELSIYWRSIDRNKKKHFKACTEL